MTALLYIISMAVAFTNMFNAELMPFYVKYIIALFWIAVWMFKFGFQKKRIPKSDIVVVRSLCLPYLIIGVWSVVVWIVDRPAVFGEAFVTRMIGNVLYIVISYCCAVAAFYIFGKKAIKLSLIAMTLSVLVNFVYVTSLYGVNMFISYLPNIFTTNELAFGSRLENYATALEVQDITMASGFYIIYFLFFDKDSKKGEKWFYVILALICSLIGFKRTTFMGFAVALLIIFLTRTRKKEKSPLKSKSIKNSVIILSIVFAAVSFAYIIAIKQGLVANLFDSMNVDDNGRIYIYKLLANNYEISPLYLGKGFSYVDKLMYESTDFASHSVIVRMFAEIGFIPFFIWLFHFTAGVPLKFNSQYGYTSARITFIAVMYLFTTFFMENTMTLFTIQFSFALMVQSSLFNKTDSEEEKIIIKNSLDSGENKDG